MTWQLAFSHTDYLLQLSALLRDPIYRGTHMPQGRGEPVLLIPGFFAGDWTLSTMAGWLNRLGYRAHLSGIDWNIDCPNRTGELLRWRLKHIQQAEAAPLIIIGHSLGGLLARFLGRTFPASVRHVIALGSPITRPLRVHPLVHSTFLLLQPLRRLKGRTAPQCGSLQCPCSFNQTVFSPLPPGVGFTSIFSKKDEVVDWRASLDPAGDNREVSGRHLGLIVNPQVYRLIAQILSSYSQGRAERETAAPTAGPGKNGHETATKQDL